MLQFDFLPHQPSRKWLARGLFVAAALLPVSLVSQTPPNDDFANRTVISGSATTVTGSDVGATQEAGEPKHAGLYGGASVWWTWNAPSNGTVTLDTYGSSFDTVLAVYTGTSVSNLTALASNDDVGTNGISRLRFSSVAGNDYQIAVDGCGGTTGSIILNLWLGSTPPFITNQPQSQTVVVGSIAGWSVPSAGTPPLYYQWRKDGADMPGATSVTLEFYNGVKLDQAGDYSVVISNAVGRIVSSNATLSVGYLFITNPPRRLVLAEGYSGSFSVGAAGGAHVFYQWRRDGLDILNATNTSHSITNAVPGDAAVFTVVVSNAWNSVTSSPVSLEVISPYTFSTLAGQTRQYGTNDGTWSAARFFAPHGIAIDPAGNLLVTDIGAQTVRRITPDGIVSTIAGVPGVSGNRDGDASVATFGWPWGIAVDRSGTIYLGDTLNGSIRKISTTGVVTTVASGFDHPSGMSTDANGNLYFTEERGYAVWKMAPDASVGAVAGLRGARGFADGKGSAAQFNDPSWVGVNETGQLYVADQHNHVIRQIALSGQVTTAAGLAKNSSGWSFDGTGDEARFNTPHGVAVDCAGNVFVVEDLGSTVRRMTPDGVVTTLAGLVNTTGYSDGSGKAARFCYPRAIAVDRAGNLYITDYDNTTIRKGVPFAVTNLPQNQAVLAGTNVTLSVGAAGTGPYFYRWFFNGVSLPDQTSTTIDLGPVQRTNSGVYSVIVSNAVGNSIRFDAVVRALFPPVLLSPTVLEGGGLRLSFLDSDGGIPYDVSGLTLFWRTNLPGGTDTNWQVLTNCFYLTNGLVAVDDTNPVIGASRFYRILEH